MTSWAALQTELDQWSEAGLSATFWWRDDDASTPSARLDQLLDLVARFDVPISLSVIPALTESSLRDRLAAENQITVLQHGYAHANFEPTGRPESELGRARKIDTVWIELAQGMRHLQNLYGERFLPVLVPPWGRIHKRLIPGLASRGWVGLSRFGARKEKSRLSYLMLSSAKNVVETNIHADLLDWDGPPKFAGEDSVIVGLVRHLTGRRLGQSDLREPTGLMTHHLDHDAEAWTFLQELLSILVHHPAASWMTAKEAFQVDA